MMSMKAYGSKLNYFSIMVIGTEIFRLYTQELDICKTCVTKTLSGVEVT